MTAAPARLTTSTGLALGVGLGPITAVGVRAIEAARRASRLQGMKQLRPQRSRLLPQRWRLVRPTAPEGPRRYDARVERPLLQSVVRTVLWAALGIGCIGGVVAILRPTGAVREIAPDPAAGAEMVPAPVAGVAELTVERWLTASPEERRRLDDLFAEPPPPDDAPGDDTAGLDVGQVTTVGGERLDGGYWSVTIAVEVPGTQAPDAPDGTASETSTTTAATGDATGPPTVPAPTTWFVEIGVVRAGDGGLVALTAPSVVPAPVIGDPEWSVSGTRTARVADDPMADLVERFLSALLAGAGDPAPYLAPGTEIRATRPPVFADVAVLELATEDLDDGQVWVSAQVTATTPDDLVVPLSYDLVLVERADRWEVVELSGVPTLIE